MLKHFIVGSLAFASTVSILIGHRSQTHSFQFEESFCGSGTSNAEALNRLGLPQRVGQEHSLSRLVYENSFTSFRFQKSGELLNKRCEEIRPDSNAIVQAEGLGPVVDGVMRVYVSVITANLLEVDRGRSMLRNENPTEIRLYPSLEGGAIGSNAAPIPHRIYSEADLLFARNTNESKITLEAQNKIFESREIIKSDTPGLTKEQLIGVFSAARIEALRIADRQFDNKNVSQR